MRRVVVLSAFVLVSMFAALAPPGMPTEAQANCFSQTGFCITNPAFADYYRLRGEERILGFPISRSFTLEGFEVQFFQRVVLQMQGGQVARLNVLDPNVMPMTRANGSTFPPPDPALAAQAPPVSSPTYAQDVDAFIKKVSPNTFNGQPVGFYTLFSTTVPAGTTTDPNLVTLLNLEIWGVPTSNPAPDPANGGFIYQRWQRGIMHFRAEVPVTEGILVGEYFKAVITGRSLPPDLAQDMQGSRYSGQYQPGAPGWVARPSTLPNTDMTNAFEPGTGNVTPPPVTPVATQPGATATATMTTTPSAVGPQVTLQVDDDRIDPGQTISVTVIARYATPIDWIQFEGVAGDNNNDNEAVVDPALSRQEFDCDGRTECANVWQVTPTISGDVTLRARARGEDGVRSEWSTLTLRVRTGTVTATPGTPTATPVVVTATPVVATATPTTAAATPTTAAATPTATQPAVVTVTPTPTP
jgi:hypothetical protein